MQIIRHNLSSIYTKLNKILRCSGGGFIVVISALFILGASGDRFIEQRQLEAQEYIDQINRGQRAYYSENGSFTNRIDELGLDIPTETENYIYKIQTLEEERVLVIAIPKSRDLKSYAGAAFVAKIDGYYYATQAIICESERSSQVPPSTAWFEGRLICGLGSSPPIANLSIKEKQFEAQAYIFSLNKSQQAYYAETASFTDKIEELGLSFFAETESYRYQIKAFEDKWVVTTATPKINGLKSYTGVVFVFVIPNEGYLTKSIVCESPKPSSIPAFTAWVGEEVKCVFGSLQL